jgi:hypothetical protein
MPNEAQERVRDLSTKMLAVVEDGSLSTAEKATGSRRTRTTSPSAQKPRSPTSRPSTTSSASSAVPVSPTPRPRKRTPPSAPAQVKSLGQQFAEGIKPAAPAVRRLVLRQAVLHRPGRAQDPLSEGTLGHPGPRLRRDPDADRAPGHRGNPPRAQLTIADLFPSGTTDSPLLRYVVQSAYTNAAATVAEGALKPEGAQTLAVVDATLSKIAETYHVTDEMLEDFSRSRASSTRSSSAT